jgi:hypothetical protein
MALRPWKSLGLPWGFQFPNKALKKYLMHCILFTFIEKGQAEP